MYCSSRIGIFCSLKQWTEFEPFGDGRYRVQGEFTTAYDINFATYQAITTADPYGRPRYLSYPSNFFQVIIVDECHRGSAKEASSWRRVLEHFESAIQIGLTATPLSTETVQTDEYFGEPLYQYSLRMGITDGFLAPYRVRRVLIGQAADEEPLTSPGEEQDQGEQQTQQVSLDNDEFSLVDIPISMESPGTMITYTKPIAQHLAAFLQRTDPFAKTIVFCVDQAHAEAMRAALANACAAFAPTNADYVVRIVSDEGPDGKRALGSFTTPDERFPVIVTTSKLLGTGVDVPTCKNIVLAFDAICETRTLTKAGYARFRNFLLYGERSLAGKKTRIDIFQDVLTLEYGEHYETIPFWGQTACLMSALCLSRNGMVFHKRGDRCMLSRIGIALQLLNSPS